MICLAIIYCTLNIHQLAVLYVFSGFTIRTNASL